MKRGYIVTVTDSGHRSIDVFVPTWPKGEGPNRSAQEAAEQAVERVRGIDDGLQHGEWTAGVPREIAFEDVAEP